MLLLCFHCSTFVCPCYFYACFTIYLPTKQTLIHYYFFEIRNGSQLLCSLGARSLEAHALLNVKLNFSKDANLWVEAVRSSIQEGFLMVVLCYVNYCRRRTH